MVILLLDLIVMGGRDQLLVGVLANKNQGMTSGMTNTKTNISGISSVFRVILLLVVVLVVAVVLLVIGGDRFKEHDAAMVSL